MSQEAYVDMRNTVDQDGADQFIKAMNKGQVGPKGQNGIKMLSGNGFQKGATTYMYEVKVFDKALANYRLYGNSTGSGGFWFEVFAKAMH